MKIEFSSEAYDSFARAIEEMKGYTVCITASDEQYDPTLRCEIFDAIIVGSYAYANDQDWSSISDEQWGDTVFVRRFDESTGDPTGPVFPVRINVLHIY